MCLTIMLPIFFFYLRLDWVKLVFQVYKKKRKNERRKIKIKEDKRKRERKKSEREKIQRKKGEKKR